MLDRVESIVREVAATVVVPKFRALEAGEIEEKAPGELVTVADRESERVLALRLTDLLPGSLVVGEESVSADPAVLDLLQGPEPIWVIDPIDGTANFAAGREPFALMVALVQAGQPRLAVIFEPIAGLMSMAESGSGAFINGERVTMATVPVPTSELRGSVLSRFLPPELRARVQEGAASLGELLPGHHCAAREYPDVVRDVQQFAMFWRVLPWDHVPGTLVVREAGGVVRRFSGDDYNMTESGQGLLIARDEEVYDQVRQALLA
ncbi:fructose-1,6-bisphosphatase/inositol monophosphatase family enzyme [Allocatelliglobosispora scoriae]|uniref:Fructose-1,6-bisphosphatase/inositol monophosphatase family enzyme n=1 Tax=Allocatelliglobosispora scoriae TaxID=643052 RepID=A0A841BW28_9ACTN|nr:inositol monophosphatase family protein [Allocatelliglobosispora scoriae]MBB5871359.1 fructose-1,6-bisphosphatase/inositol monophosphatase family enzyme [Allocatelliglobosispora scoriae]